MTSISIQIPMSPVSLNDTHRLVKFGKRASRIKTTEFVAWENEFLHHLKQYDSLKLHLLENYRDDMNCFTLEVFLYLNNEKYFAKPKSKKANKTISKRSKDVSNCIKPAEDQIFRWLGIDDSQVSRIIAEKIPTNHDCTMVFRISLVKFPELFLVSVESV